MTHRAKQRTRCLQRFAMCRKRSTHHAVLPLAANRQEGCQPLGWRVSHGMNATCLHDSATRKVGDRWQTLTHIDSAKRYTTSVVLAHVLGSQGNRSHGTFSTAAASAFSLRSDCDHELPRGHRRIADTYPEGGGYREQPKESTHSAELACTKPLESGELSRRKEPSLQATTVHIPSLSIATTSESSLEIPRTLDCESRTFWLSIRTIYSKSTCRQCVRQRRRRPKTIALERLPTATTGAPPPPPPLPPQTKKYQAADRYLRRSKGVPTGDMRRTSPEAEASTKHALPPPPASSRDIRSEADGSVSAHRIDTIGLWSVQALNLMR